MVRRDTHFIKSQILNDSGVDNFVTVDYSTIWQIWLFTIRWLHENGHVHHQPLPQAICFFILFNFISPNDIKYAENHDLKQPLTLSLIVTPYVNKISVIRFICWKIFRTQPPPPSSSLLCHNIIWIIRRKLLHLHFILFYFSQVTPIQFNTIQFIQR